MKYQKNSPPKNKIYSDNELKATISLKNSQISLQKSLSQLSKQCSRKITAHKDYDQELIFVNLNNTTIADTMDCLCAMYHTSWQKTKNGYLLLPYIPGLHNHLPNSPDKKKAMELLSEFSDKYQSLPKSMQSNLNFSETQGTKTRLEDLPKPLQENVRQFAETQLKIISEKGNPSKSLISLLENPSKAHVGFRIESGGQRIPQMQMGIKKDNTFFSTSIPNVIGEIKKQQARKNDANLSSYEDGKLTKEEQREKEAKDERLNRRLSLHLNQASHPRFLLEVSRQLPDLNLITHIPMRPDDTGPFHFSNIPLKTVLNEATQRFRYQKWEMRKSGHIFMGINHIPDKEL